MPKTKKRKKNLPPVISSLLPDIAAGHTSDQCSFVYAERRWGGSFSHGAGFVWEVKEVGKFGSGFERGFWNLFVKVAISIWFFSPREAQSRCLNPYFLRVFAREFEWFFHSAILLPNSSSIQRAQLTCWFWLCWKPRFCIGSLLLELCSSSAESEPFLGINCNYSSSLRFTFNSWIYFSSLTMSAFCLFVASIRNRLFDQSRLLEHELSFIFSVFSVLVLHSMCTSSNSFHYYFLEPFYFSFPEEFSHFFVNPDHIARFKWMCL